MKFLTIVVLSVVVAFSAASMLPCGPHEVYLSCGSACPETCDTLGEVRPCTKQCVRGCFCEQGYVRDSVTGVCVQPCDCPPKPSTTTTPVPTDTTCS